MKTDKNFDILEIRNYYPSKNNPTSSTWVYNQVIGLQKLGYNPLVISPTPINPLKLFMKKRYALYDVPSSRLEIFKNTNVIRPGYIKIPNNKFKQITINRLTNCITRNGNLKSIKLIHAHFGQNGVAALKLKKQLGIPLITSFYGYDSGRLATEFKPYYRALIKDGDLFLALSNDMKKDLINLGFPDNKIVVHHLGIDLNIFSAQNIENEKFTILTVARFDETKGIHLVIKALKMFFEKNPEERNHIIYKIVGGGSFENRLKELVNKYNLQQNVQFINNIIVPNGREIVLTEMRKCDLFVLCSSTPNSGGKEGTPVVLMEAQACGRPCIATFHAGIPEVVINNETGILVKEHSAKEIEDAISLLYFDKDKLIRYGENAIKHIEKNFNDAIQIKKLDTIIKLLITN